MRSLRHLLPSAGSLIVFEAAGRLSSFTAAGRELGMTQAAVSYAVRGLEDYRAAFHERRRYGTSLPAEECRPWPESRTEPE